MSDDDAAGTEAAALLIQATRARAWATVMERRR
jgi:hypothetical protein